MTNTIHPTAIVHPSAKIGEGTVIGPYSIVGEKVTLGARVRLHSHVVVDGICTIGDGTEIYPFSTIGLAPQDKKYRGEATSLAIGSNCIIREHCTFHTGTVTGNGHTQVGNDGLFMVNCHIAHDCRIGNGVILANNATLGGHVEIGDFVIIGGVSAVHQFVRIGAYAMIGGMSGIEADIIPYGIAMGDRARLQGLNLVGLKRRGYSHSAIKEIRRAYNEIFDPDRLMPDKITSVRQNFADNREVMTIVEFIAAESHRNISQPRQPRQGRGSKAQLDD